jgi:hypothetical protein
VALFGTDWMKSAGQERIRRKVLSRLVTPARIGEHSASHRRPTGFPAAPRRLGWVAPLGPQQPALAVLAALQTFPKPAEVAEKHRVGVPAA